MEWKYGTDKDNPISHPQPEILAGFVSSRNGDEVTVLLKLANSGSIDAVMYAPDDTVTIGNNTVGGNGRMRPGTEIAVGSLVLGPDLSNWTNSTAMPYANGNYTGISDKTITRPEKTEGRLIHEYKPSAFITEQLQSGELALAPFTGGRKACPRNFLVSI
ncbi:MAG: hypothetical protein WAM60_13985 [Candidatus Promineifilaceae bacterium]